MPEMFVALRSRLLQLSASDESTWSSMTTCSVPGCRVSSETLARWRLAAVRLLGFPAHKPLALHPGQPEWAEHVGVPNPVAVCSLHFRDTAPTAAAPVPTELLSAKPSKPAWATANVPAVTVS
jgi:hypothetical protein